MLPITRSSVGLDAARFNWHDVEANNTMAVYLRIEPQIHLGTGNSALGDILGFEREHDVQMPSLFTSL